MKRGDLQGTRGFAIVLVLLFHVFPKTFGNGFSGVDIFFVLSGYLMAMIYKEKVSDANDFVQFYKKRFLRLLPMYALTILATVLAGKMMIIANFFEFLANDTKWALGLATNVENLVDHTTYWDQVNQFKYLLHTWSLAVEMQYYLVVPFLFALENKYPRFGAAVTNLLALGSLIFNLVTPGTWGFDFLLARVWQFHLGALSWAFTTKIPRGYRIAATEDHESLLKNEKDSEEVDPVEPEGLKSRLRTYFYLFLSLALVFLLFPTVYFQLPEKVVRVIATVLTAVLFRFSDLATVTPLANRAFCFLGDISYTLYLIHWPVIIFLRSCYDITAYSYVEGAVLITVLISVSAAVHFGVEKPLLKKTATSIWIILIAYFVTGHFVLNIKTIEVHHALWHDNPEQFWSFVEPKPTWSRKQIVENAIFVNQFYAKQRWLLPKWTGSYSDLYVVPSNETSNSTTLKVLNLGNSFALRTTNIVEKVLRGKFKEMRLTTESGWEPLDPYGHPEFIEDKELHMKDMYAMKPDVIFLIHRFSYKYSFRKNPIVGDLADDNATQVALEELWALSNVTKKIIWGGMITDFDYNMGTEMSQRLSTGRSTEDLYEYPYAHFLEQQKYSIPRVKYILDRCSNCVWYDMQAPFCDANLTKCYAYNKDTLLSYYGDSFHLDWSGMKQIEKSFTDITVKVMKELGYL